MSIRTALALNSAVPDFGSVASIVSTFVATSSGKWSVMKARPGLTFMTFHFPDDVATNLLTIDATDPKSGTAEFKATAVSIEAVSI